jgi:hypothetical protein
MTVIFKDIVAKAGFRLKVAWLEGDNVVARGDYQPAR